LKAQVQRNKKVNWSGLFVEAAEEHLTKLGVNVEKLKED